MARSVRSACASVRAYGRPPHPLAAIRRNAGIRLRISGSDMQDRSCPNNAFLVWGIDVRGLGGYVIAPGATLTDGRSYRIIAGTWDAIPALPELLATFLREKHSTVTPALPGAPVGRFVTDRERAFAQAALADEAAKLSAMPEGSGRNRALNDAAHSLGTMDGWIDLNAVSNALWEASIANGYVAKDGEAQTRATIESGINAGRSKPRSLLASCVPNIDVSAMVAKRHCSVHKSAS